MSTPSGQVFLCKNALIDNSYNHTIDFKSPDEQLAYWGSLTSHTLTNFSYIRRTSQSLKVNLTLDELKEVNYLYFRSGKDLKLYYCFVTSKEYANDNMTYIYFEIDVLQTYMFDYKVKPSYVIQEHADRWDINHNPIYSITDEGLDYGSEYLVESAYKVEPTADIPSWYLIVCKAHNALISEGFNATETTRIGNVANPFIYYLVPCDLNEHQKASFIGNYEGFTTAVEIGNLHDFTDAMAEESGIGSFVQAIVKLPYLPFNVQQYGDFFDFSYDTSNYFAHATISGKKYIRIIQVASELQKTLAAMGVFEGIESAMPTAEQWEDIKKNPYTTERDRRFESKLLTHPYRYNLLTDWKTQPIVIKNEYIGGDKITLKHTQSISPNAPARYWVEGYKKDPEGRGSSLLQTMQEDSPIVTDAYQEYMLSNRNQLQADRVNSIISGSANIAQAGISGGSLIDPWGSVKATASATIGFAVNHSNMIRSQNAKQNDVKNLPDTIVSSNDSSMAIQDKNEFVSFYRMKICCEFEELLADTFNMSGYTIKRVKMPNLKTRARFNYVRTIGANIVGSFDQDDLAKIRAIFDNGVTFWHWHKDHFNMFDYSLENIETKLI